MGEWGVVDVVVRDGEGRDWVLNLLVVPLGLVLLEDWVGWWVGGLG